MPIIEDVEHDQELQKLQATIHTQRQYILELEEYIRNGRRKLFGPSSEKLVDLHPSLFNEAEAEASVEPVSTDKSIEHPGVISSEHPHFEC